MGQPGWTTRAQDDADQDVITTIFDGQPPDTLACDTTLRVMPDGSWVTVMLGGGHTEPLPQNRVFLSRSTDAGRTWSPMRPIALRTRPTTSYQALIPTELMVRGDECTLYVATHDGSFGSWRTWSAVSRNAGRTWSHLDPITEALHARTFIRSHITTRDGRLLLPFQHYLKSHPPVTLADGRRFTAPADPRIGVLMSTDGGRHWTVHGDIRLSDDPDYHGWAENALVELDSGRVVMLIRADGLGGVLYRAESTDGGRTWPGKAHPTDIPNPGSKATLYGLGHNRVALLHNPNPAHRSPLALWVSFDGMQTWPYRRVVVAQSADGPAGALNYPDGFVTPDGRWLCFAFDDNRHRAVCVRARLPVD